MPASDPAARELPAADLPAQVATLRARVAQLELESRAFRTQTAVGPPLAWPLATHAPIIVFAFDQDGVITVSEGSALPSTGRTQQEILGQSFFDVYADVPQVVACARRALAGDSCTAQVTLGQGVFEIYYTPVPGPGGVITGVGGLAIDVTARFQAVQALTHQALHDPLTDLPNRALLLDRLGLAVAAASREPASLALLLLDLDRFKEINDTFGHHYGDMLLQQVGVRLRAALRESDTLARLGGDEFAVLLPRTDQAGALHTARKLGETLEVPFTVEQHVVQVGVSIGVASYPMDSQDAPTLLRHADVAMYLAKQAQHGPVVYAPDQDEHSPHRLALVVELREAIAGAGLLLHYQPVVDLATRRVTAVEALVRWAHPSHGLLAPGQFIPLAESTGLMTLLTDWVLEAALRQRQHWQQAGIALDVAINISMSGLHESGLADTTQRLLQRYGVPAAALRLEITESTLMRDVTRTQEVLARLAEFGVHLAVDDFGTGYSSLAYLKQLPVDEIKIDRSFVQDSGSNLEDAAIISAIVGLGHGLGLSVTAEGVETAAIWEQMLRQGCDGAQGYYVSHPLPPEALDVWLAQAPWKQPA
ncbi:MAG: putative bifunctional diguanylate cyclase/phosphodiesterase [Chloroflexia bacterium]